MKSNKKCFFLSLQKITAPVFTCICLKARLALPSMVITLTYHSNTLKQPMRYQCIYCMSMGLLSQHRMHSMLHQCVSCNSVEENEIKGLDRACPVTQKYVQIPFIHLCQNISYVHQKEKRKKPTAIITLHQHAEISENLTAQVKGFSAFILQRHANVLSFCLLPSFQ